eukprot:gene47894-36307_t
MPASCRPTPAPADADGVAVEQGVAVEVNGVHITAPGGSHIQLRCPPAEVGGSPRGTPRQAQTLADRSPAVGGWTGSADGGGMNGTAPPPPDR